MRRPGRPDPSPLAGRTAVVTGAASGIGRALARRLAAHGCPVALADHDAAGLEATAAALPTPVLARALDVRDRAAVGALAAEVAAWAPAPLGVVVNNAGVTTVQGLADGVPEDDAWVLDVNLGGVVNGTRAFLPLLLAQDAGAIVNTSSVFGLMGAPHQSAYCASKFAVRGFTEALRLELRGTGVRAVVVHPGGVRTDIVNNARWRADHRGRHADRDAAARDFAAAALTSPERAAEVIHRGVERGDARILVGPDARVIDLLTRVAPTHAFAVLERLDEITHRRRRSR